MITSWSQRGHSVAIVVAARECGLAWPPMAARDWRALAVPRPITRPITWLIRRGRGGTAWTKSPYGTRLRGFGRTRRTPGNALQNPVPTVRRAYVASCDNLFQSVTSACSGSDYRATATSWSAGYRGTSLILNLTRTAELEQFRPTPSGSLVDAHIASIRGHTHGTSDRDRLPFDEHRCTQ